MRTTMWWRGLVALATSLVLAVALLGEPASAAASDPNGYSYSLGSCDPATGRTPGMAYFRNGGNAPIDIYVSVDTLATHDPEGDGVAFGVMPGETRPIDVSSPPWNGFTPGTHVMRFDVYGTWQKLHEIEFLVPFVEGCSRQGYPDGDPAGESTSKVVKPKGRVIQITVHKVKVVAIYKGTPTKLRIVIKPKTGKKVVRKFGKVRANKKRIKRYLSAQPGTRFVLQGWTEKKNGKVGWLKLARRTVSHHDGPTGNSR